MDKKEFKIVFGEIAKTNGFKKAFGGWYKESNECLVVLELQKSNYGAYYYLNFKIYIQSLFNEKYVINKDLVATNCGDVFSRPPLEYGQALDFDEEISDEKRVDILGELFDKYVVPLTARSLSISGVNELAKEGQFVLFPAVEKELNRLLGS